MWWPNFYPRSPCGERRLCADHRAAIPTISIHALLAESDTTPTQTLHHPHNFYPPSPCGERRPGFPGCSCCFYFYPRSPCGERPQGAAGHIPAAGYFYPRSPCGERLIGGSMIQVIDLFLSTLSLRRATQGAVCGLLGSVISIHALLAESDAVKLAPRSCS